jgi:glycosyltransferase involved in cell wall biosynthesis
MRTANAPLISVLVCTYNRPRLLERALASVLRQDYPNLEILVVDDGSVPAVEIPAPAGDRIRLIRTEHRGVGVARCEGFNAARGEFIAYCDDDDEWRPNHLSTLLEYLREHPGVDLVYGDSEWAQEGAAPAVAYSIDYDMTQLSWSNYIFASDVLHRSQAAREAGGFDPSLQAYEDWDLWLRISRRHLLRHLPVVLGTHHWHPGCVSETRDWPTWERVYEGHGQRLGGPEAFAGQDLVPESARAAPFDPSTWRLGRRELIWRSVMRVAEGYGSVGRQLLLEFERQGVDVTVAPTRDQPQPGLERFYKPLDHWGKLGFYCDYPVRPGVLKCERIVSHSMWESTAVPADHIEAINRAAALHYVPCRQNLDSFRECGLRVPVKLLPYGVDGEQFPYLSRPRSDTFTFGCFGSFSPRKGIDVLLRAFQDEFSPREPVHLVLKNADAPPAYEIWHPRVTVFSSRLKPRALLGFLRGLDAFVLPSRGEGLGLCGLEAMATGLPVIATDWSGPAEYLDPADSYPLAYRLVDVHDLESNGVRYSGQWAEPEYEHLRHLLRWVYEHPGEAAEKGRRAAERVHARWTWDRTVREMCADFDAIAGV